MIKDIYFLTRNCLPCRYFSLGCLRRGIFTSAPTRKKSGSHSGYPSRSKRLKAGLSSVPLVGCAHKSVVQSLSRVRLCNPMDCSTPGSVGLSRQEYLAWVSVSFSRESWIRDQTRISCIGRRILHHRATKGAPAPYLDMVLKYRF